MKKFLFLGACLVVLASSVRAQATAPSVAIVTIWYGGASAGAGHLSINRDGKNEAVDFAGGMGEKASLARAEALRKVVAQLYQEGYALKAAFGRDDLIFVKGQ
jgi:opacity protein-like surface antigen